MILINFAYTKTGLMELKMSDNEVLVVIMGVVFGFLIVKGFVGSSEDNVKGCTKEGNSTESNDKKDEGATNNTSDIPDEKNIRIFQCVFCSQKMRVTIPLQSSSGKCSNCRKHYTIEVDVYGHLYIQGKADFDNTSANYNFNIDECFVILNIDKSSSPADIKKGYRSKIREYHPDKVSKLGDKLYKVAEEETKKINIAYNKLKHQGYTR